VINQQDLDEIVFIIAVGVLKFFAIFSEQIQSTGLASLISGNLSVYAANEERPPLPVHPRNHRLHCLIVVLGIAKQNVAGTGSPDGRLALCVAAPSKDAKPVDWNLLRKDREKFKDTYGDDENYFVEILLVDHKSNKNLATLKLTESWSFLAMATNR